MSVFNFLLVYINGRSPGEKKKTRRYGQQCPSAKGECLSVLQDKA